MKEKVLEALEVLGFKIETEDGSYHTFSYEGLNMLYIYNENDENFLSIALPGIMEVEDDNTIQAFALMDKINSTLKYVKAYTLGKRVWMFYERELFGGEDLEAVIYSMVLRLEAGLTYAQKALAEIEGSLADDTSDDDTGDGTEEADAEELTGNDDNE